MAQFPLERARHVSRDAVISCCLHLSSIHWSDATYPSIDVDGKPSSSTGAHRWAMTTIASYTRSRSSIIKMVGFSSRSSELGSRSVLAMVPFKLRLTILNALALYSVICVCAPSFNVTIDDRDGDSRTGQYPEYDPPGGWAQGANCGGCQARPDPSKALHGTWHDTTQHPQDPTPRTITISFSGTAVYVYNIIANHVPATDTLTSLSFMLDGEHVATYEHPPTQSSQYMYDVLVYSNGSLEDMKHTLKIQDMTSPTGPPSLVLFDYVVYTTHQPDSSSLVSI
ncbi:hypothetical protein C8Q80DRAFT_15905 [Daedaleopsis nitida]|nr:hypothetical protein C8Q80DRAFT_15905 [Daedaleopsis nitida]